MARRGASDEVKRRTAVQGARRMIAQGERPRYRIRAVGDGPEIRLAVAEMPWLAATATRRSYVLEVARAIIVEELEVDPDTFDVELVP